jgi:hypothetical protein
MLVLCLPISCVAAQPLPPKVTAVVSAGPSTTVSGTMVVDKMAAFPEDDVETHSNKMANLTFTGNSLTVLGNSHIKLHEESADLISGGMVVSTASRFIVQSSCFSAQPVKATGSRYSVSPYQGRIYIHADQGDLLVKTRREIRIPAGKTVAITSCGKPGEMVQFAGGNDGTLKAIFAGALAAGVGVAIALPDKQPVSSECPSHSCR